MTKKIWKLKPETVDLIISVCPTPEKAFEIVTKADTVFNADQDVAYFTLASLNPGKTLECKATLKLWRDECSELVEVNDNFKAPWEMTKEEIEDLCGRDDDDGDEDQNHKRVNVHVVCVGKNKPASESEKDCE